MGSVQKYFFNLLKTLGLIFKVRLKWFVYLLKLAFRYTVDALKNEINIQSLKNIGDISNYVAESIKHFERTSVV